MQLPNAIHLFGYQCHFFCIFLIIKQFWFFICFIKNSIFPLPTSGKSALVIMGRGQICNFVRDLQYSDVYLKVRTTDPLQTTWDAVMQRHRDVVQFLGRLSDVIQQHLPNRSIILCYHLPRVFFLLCETHSIWMISPVSKLFFSDSLSREKDIPERNKDIKSGLRPSAPTSLSRSLTALNS